MSTWPDIQDPSDFSEKSLSFRIKKISESGAARVRPKGTAIKKEFSLEWEAMSATDKATLETFFETYQASSFTYTHFETEVDHTVIFNDDEIEYEYLASGYWKVKLTLREV